MSLNWKSSEILRVSGSIVKEGIFTGHEANSSNRLVGNFTPDVIEKLFENISDHVPLYVRHDKMGNPTRKLVGYAYKFGKTPTNDDIKVEGFVFDQEGLRKVALEGFDSFSPEIEFTNDEGGKHVNAILSGLAFVQNPAIQGTQVNAELTAFSKAGDKEGNMSTTEFLKSKGLTDAEILSIKKGLFDEESGSGEPPAPPAEKPPVPPKATPTPTPAKDLSTDQKLEELKTQLDNTQAQLADQVSKNEQLLGMQYDTLVGEIKSLGYENPGDLVKGFPTDQKIQILSKLKASLTKDKQIAKPSGNPGPSDSGNGAGGQKKNQDDLINEALAEMGFKREEYDKIVGGSKV